MQESQVVNELIDEAESGMLYTIANIRVILRRKTIAAGSYEHLAREINVSNTYISNVVNGVQNPGPAIIRALGFEKVVLYRKICEQIS